MRRLLRWPFPAILFLLVLGIFFWNNNQNRQNHLEMGMSDQEIQSLVEKELLKCTKEFSPWPCAKRASSFLLSRMTYDELLTSLRVVTKKPEIFTICHPLVHYIGRESYKLEPDLDKLFSVDRSVCDSGFYHGVIEQNLATNGTILFKDNESKSFEAVKEVCGKLEDFTIPLRYASCIHGLGHGLMYVTNNELPVSLKGCDSIRGAVTCYGGVFMENGASATDPYHFSKYLKADDPLYPCNDVEEKYQLACYRYQSLYFAQITNRDWNKTIELCLQVPENYQGTCIQFVGSNLINFSEDISLMQSVLQNVPGQYHFFYITGLVSGLGEDNVGNPGKMKAVCDFLDGNLEFSCYKDMGVAIRAWSFDSRQRRAFCEEVLEGKAFEECVKAANVENFDVEYYRLYSKVKNFFNF